MVSSGISGNIAPVRPVDAQTGIGSKNVDSEFGMIMTQSMGSTNMEKNSYYGNSGTDPAKIMAETAKGTENRIQSSGKKENKIQEKQENVPADKVKEKLEDNPQIKETVSKIKDKIKEEFDVTDEDIEKALENLGLTMADLLDESNLTDFVVELSGMESSVDLLISSELSSGLNELLGFIQEAVNTITEEFGITVEELAVLLDKGQNAVQEEISDVPENFINEDAVQTAQNEAIAVPKQKVYDKMPENEMPDENVSEEAAEVKDNQPVVKIVKSETSSSENESMDMAKRQNSGDLAGNFVNNLTNAVNEAFDVRGLNETINPVQIIEQILETAKVVLNQETTSMELMLNPENLGKVNLNISVKEGIVTASFVAQNEAVREAIESQVVLLKENLNNQGIKIEAVEVTVESHAFEAGTGQEQNNTFNEQREEQKKQNRPLRLDSLDDLSADDLTEEEKIVLDMMANEGNQINFTA